MPYIGQIPSTGENNNFKILDDILSYTETFNGSSSGVVSVADDTLTFVSHRFITGQRITYSTTGTAIGGLVISTAYFVIKNDQNTIKLASTFANANNNVAINLTALGTGTTHTLIVAFDSINTKFKATYDNGTKALITRAGQLQISINGVIQQPQDTTSPTNGFGIDLDGVIIFSTAPANTDIFWGNVFANNFATFDISDNTVDSFTGNGSLVNFTLSKIPANNQNILVTIDGVVQYPSDNTTIRAYGLSENILTFVGAPGNATAIQVRHIGFAGATSSSVTGFYGRTGNVGLTTADNVSIGAATIGTGGIGTSLLVQGNARITGILTVGTGSITIDGVNNTISGVINTNATGVSTVGSLSIGNTSVISSGRQLQNIASLDATTTATIESAVANAPNTFTDLSVSGISTLGVTSATNLTAQSLNVSGIITATQLSTGASGTGVNISTDTISGPATLTIDPAAVGDNTGAVRIKGDLYVDGTQFIVNSTTIELADFNVGIASTVGTNALLDGAGIGIGSIGIRKTLTWNNSSTALKSSEDFDISSGKVYRVNGTSVLSNNTLGSGVVTSSLTSVGTLSSLSVTGVTIDGSGNVGINDTSPSTRISGFIVRGTDTRYFTVNKANAQPTWRYDDNGTGNALLQNLGMTAANQGMGIQFQLGDSAANSAVGGSIYCLSEQTWTSTASTKDSYLRFDTTLDGVDSTRMRISSAGNVTIDTGNLVIGTSGKGIDFSANSNAAGMTSELLADYEEGSFTPSIAFNGSDLGVVYSVRTGRYTKIGNRVFFNILLNISNKGTATGIAAITGLPFTPGAGNQGYGAAVGADIGGITFDNIITYRIVGGNTSITLIENGGAGITEADFTNTAQQIVSGHYYVD